MHWKMLLSTCCQDRTNQNKLKNQKEPKAKLLADYLGAVQISFEIGELFDFWVDFI